MADIVGNLLETIDKVRSVSGQLGINRYQVDLVRISTDSTYGSLPQQTEERLEISTYGQNPKVENITYSDILRGYDPEAEIKVTVTPAYVRADGYSGGYQLSDFEPRNASEQVHFEVKKDDDSWIRYIKTGAMVSNFALTLILKRA